MDRSLWSHAALAALASVAAYLAWVKPTATDSDSSVVVVAGTPERLTEITYEEGGTTTTVKRDGTAAIISVTAPPKTLPAPEDAPKDLAQPAAAQTREYPGAEKATELFAALAPLKATRSLGRPDDEKRKALGLAPAVSTLKLRFGDDERVVRFGNATYGSGSLYAGPDGGEVFLLAGSTVQGLKNGAAALIERNIIGVGREKIARIVISGGGKGREFVQRDAEERGKAYFADPADPETKLVKSGEWLDRLLRLRLIELTNEVPKGEPVLVAELWSDKELLEELRLFEDGDKDAVVTTKRWKRPVTVVKATLQSLLDQLDAVVSEGK